MPRTGREKRGITVITLVYNRYVQKNVGTALRPEWETVSAPTGIVVAEGDGIRERGHNEPIHFFEGSGVLYCMACGDLNDQCWTDNKELYARHPMRCNYAFDPTREQE